MELLALAWIGGLIAYFHFTTEEQRQGALLIVWVLMLLPVLYWGGKLLLL